MSDDIRNSNHSGSVRILFSTSMEGFAQRYCQYPKPTELTARYTVTIRDVPTSKILQLRTASCNWVKSLRHIVITIPYSSSAVGMIPTRSTTVGAIRIIKRTSLLMLLVLGDDRFSVVSFMAFQC